MLIGHCYPSRFGNQIKGVCLSQGSLTREGTLYSNLFVPVKSAHSQLIPSKSVGKSTVPTIEKPHLPTLLAADPLIPEHDTLHTMQLLSVSLPLL